MNTVRTGLLRELRSLPLHSLTLARLSRHVAATKSIPRLKHVAETLQNFHDVPSTKKHTQYKILTTLLLQLYCQWDNSFSRLSHLPPHLAPFEQDFPGLVRIWPRESHLSLKQSTKGHATLKHAWVTNNKHALQMSFDAAAANPTSGNIELRGSLRQILSHYQLLYNNMRMFGKIKLQVPVAEIPLNVFGEEIPACRTANLLQRKVGYVKRVLIEELPALYNTECIAELTAIIAGDGPAARSGNYSPRQLRRLYRRAFAGCYTLASTAQEGQNGGVHSFALRMLCPT
ncbi:Gep5p KNAG_0G02060 [Huiozyma naganishii CBS 8797]|uniref:Genetic interactor of prohibitin 5, mitochondrial n=1 Tax=Huiozyma naganishii (strain ATCC MYA-139 / BCRC 22969 / CBS 8797 / KCTC 17520 / NBRC 10181 / NCYC 3082 / Yp74L-3) TaxID=1071383 RepID=J7RNT4_HUIN7|nr:hypothetical protein KNAG_0G02060 [Kazachstania naganishii CBS 8797]CCK71263.1 hypothetical protein KNAG_0G02060 [Kazachstania naganishii CBS 8797]